MTPSVMSSVVPLGAARRIALRMATAFSSAAPDQGANVMIEMHETVALAREASLRPDRQWSPTGWQAMYVSRVHDGPEPWTPNYDPMSGNVYGRAVEAWGRDGEALVVDPLKGALVDATTEPGYVRLVQTGRLQSVLRADPGWTVEMDDGTGTLPVAAWMVDIDGTMRPVPAVDVDGALMAAEDLKALQVRPPVEDHTTP
jgi:hypothetical protein